MRALNTVIQIAKKHETNCVPGSTSNYSVTQAATAELAQLRAAKDEARKVIEHVLRADEDDREWDAQELVDWLEANPKEQP